MIHYVCVATESKLYLPYLKQLIPNLVILGINTKWEGFITKIKLIINYLKTLNEDDIVCILDAYDILPTKNIIHLEEKFIAFTNENPQTKMIIGYDKNNNIIQEKIAENFVGSVNGIRLNAGQYIGYVKNIKFILCFVLNNNPKMSDDQLELTKYANHFPNDVYIDINKQFFFVSAGIDQYTLQQIAIDQDHSDFSFVHAAENGCLEDFLWKEHNIKVNPINKIKNFKDNFQEIISKKTNQMKKMLDLSLK